MNYEILKKIGYNSVALEMLLKREASINTDDLMPEQDDSDYENLYILQNKLLTLLDELKNYNFISEVVCNNNVKPNNNNIYTKKCIYKSDLFDLYHSKRVDRVGL